jgi:hypothetical protein
MKKWIVPGVIGGLIFIFVAIGVLTWISYNNKEIDLRNQAKAQQQANQVVYDKVWKILQQKAGVLDKYASDFKDIYKGIMNERYQGDAKQAPLFKWIQEQNPQFSEKMFLNLSDAIEAQRGEFAMVQKRLIDIKREHDNLRQKFPGNIIVGSRGEIKIDIVTSTKTEKTFETGKEDQIDLFEKKAQEKK